MKKKLFVCLAVLLLAIGMVPQKAYALTYEKTLTAQPKLVWDYLYAFIGNPYGVAGIMGNFYTESHLVPTQLDNTACRVFGTNGADYTDRVDSGEYTEFATDKSYYGLNQWGYTRKQKLLEYAQSIDASIGSYEAQLGFVQQEMNTAYFRNLFDFMKNATSVREASDEWLRVYGGVPDKDEFSRSYRAEHGQEYFDAYAPAEYKTGEAVTPPAQTGSENAEGTQTQQPENQEGTQVQQPENTQTGEQGGTQTTPDNTQTQPDNTQKTPDNTQSGGNGTQIVPDNTKNTDNTQNTGNSGSGNTQTEPAAPVVTAPAVPKSSDANLKALSLSEGSLYPAFSPKVTNYIASVGNGVTSVKVDAEKNHSGASVSVSGGTKLKEGVNQIKVSVTAENGNKKTYNVSLTRKVPGTCIDADLDVAGTQDLSGTEQFIESSALETAPAEQAVEQSQSVPVLEDVLAALPGVPWTMPYYMLFAILAAALLLALVLAM